MPQKSALAAYKAIFVHNRDQMYFPKTDAIYGSNFQSVKINQELLKNNNSLFVMDYSVKRTHWKALDTQDKRCDASNSPGNVTQCVTHYLEYTIGCSMSLAFRDPKVKR